MLHVKIDVKICQGTGYCQRLGAQARATVVLRYQRKNILKLIQKYIVLKKKDQRQPFTEFQERTNEG